MRRYGTLYAVLFFLLLLGLHGCGKFGLFGGGESSGSGRTGAKTQRGTKPYTIGGKTYYPLLSAHGYSEEGVASWYGPNFHGKQTANGERYDMYGMTAAHKILPFETRLRVTNLNNGKSIEVRVNDRGPFVANRVIDLTKAGAERLGMIGAGTARVRLESIGAVKGLQDGDLKGSFYVQIGAFSVKSNAEALKARMSRRGGVRTVYADQVNMWRVQVGPYPSLATAENAADGLSGEFGQAFVVAD